MSTPTSTRETLPSTYPYPGMPRVAAAVTDTATGRTGLLAARFRFGHVTHVVKDQPDWRASMGLGRLVLFATPLCYRDIAGTRRPSKRRGSSSTFLIVGGHVTPTEPSVALGEARSACPTCARRLSDLTYPA